MFDVCQTRRNFIFFLGIFSACPKTFGAEAPSLAGLWRTIDDKTRKARGVVRLYEQQGALFGKIERSYDPKEANDVCDKCTDDRRNKPVVGMVFLRNMKRHGATEYTGGDILDPDSGWLYRCKISVEEGGKKLVVRGFLGLSLIGRSQIWLREE